MAYSRTAKPAEAGTLSGEMEYPVLLRPAAANRVAGLGWAGLGWAGLGWAGLGWAGLGWAGLGWAGLGWAGLGWAGLKPSLSCGGTASLVKPLDAGWTLRHQPTPEATNVEPPVWGPALVWLNSIMPSTPLGTDGDTAAHRWPALCKCAM